MELKRRGGVKITPTELHGSSNAAKVILNI